jgi:hypothetical protein
MSMSTAHGWRMILASFSLVATACGGPPPPADPIGQNGGNGLEPTIYLDNQAELGHLMELPLAPSGHTLEPRAQGFLAGGTPADRHLLLQYATDCALPFATYDQLEASNAGARLFQGSTEPDAGILNDGAAWPTTPLNPEQRLALSTCLLTRLNPSGRHVSIWLNGMDVNHTSRPAAGGFDFVEAHWLALPTPIDVPVWDGPGATKASMLVWPSRRWKAACQPNEHRLTPDARTRVCGKAADSAACDVAVAPDGWCKETVAGNGIWTCTIPGSGLPQPLHAIETRLQPSDWRYLHTQDCDKI